MGIKGLKAILRTRAPKSIQKIKLSSLSGKTVAFDASLFVYKWYLAAGGNIKNKDGRAINHIQGALFNTVCMQKHGINPVYVFDGKPPVEKEKTLEARRARQVNCPPKEIWTETRDILRLMGVTSVTAPGEADAYLASLTLFDVANICATDDMDILAFGATQVLTDIDCTRGTATLITLEDVLTGLGMTQVQFIDFCILLGSDYTETTLPRIGPSRSYDMIKKHKSISAIIENENIQAPIGFTYQAARDVFSAAPPSTITEVTTCERDPLLKQWLTDMGITGKRIDNLF
jgi:flap endonuclease-1